MGQGGEDSDTIVAVSTPPGSGGIAVIRVSGPEALAICSRGWHGKNLREVKSHTAHLGSFYDHEGNELDQCVATVFREGRSYTGEDTVELAVHGSRWIQRAIVEALTSFGARAAKPGEFTQRAFLNGRLDLAQAEGVADLISSSSRASHRLAMQQASGGFSRAIESIREQLVEFAALIELELDFSEEDVEFADRGKLLALANSSRDSLKRLADTFRSGQALKEGVPVVIAGLPNAGKSTLLNRLLREDKAIVTPIAGTTRDILEDTVEIGGILFRFIDTAGLHDTTDEVERIGIGKAVDRMQNARIVIWMTDTTAPVAPQLDELRSHLPALISNDTHIIHFLNKTDSPLSTTPLPSGLFPEEDRITEISGSAAEGKGTDVLEATLTRLATEEYNPDTDIIVTNARHAAALTAAAEALTRAIENLEAGISSDLIAMDIREATAHLSELTGTLTTDTLLHHIFSRFCVGK